MAMMISMSILVICCGVLCLTDTEFAWRIYEWDCRLMNIAISRPANWIVQVKRIGYAFVGLGILGIIASMNI